MKEKIEFRKGISVTNQQEGHEIEGKVRKAIEEKIIFSASDFFGPAIQLAVTKAQGKITEIRPLEDTYICEDTAISIGIERLLEEFSRQYFKENGKFYLVSKFGKIMIDSENTEEIVIEFKKNISIF